MSLISVNRPQRVTSQFLGVPSISTINSSTSSRWSRYFSRRCSLQMSAVCFCRFLVPNPSSAPNRNGSASRRQFRIIRHSEIWPICRHWGTSPTLDPDEFRPLRTMYRHGRSASTQAVYAKALPLARTPEYDSSEKSNHSILNERHLSPLGGQLRHTRYSRRTVQSIVTRCARSAGIKKRVFPHLLRHSI